RGVVVEEVVGAARAVFFFSSRTRHARSYGDWSSDVCSSDLPPAARTVQGILRECDQAGGRAPGEDSGRAAAGAAAQDGSRRLVMAGELISREALERIIQRAAELQAGEHDIGDGLTESELLSLGQDVGIPARHLRQALLEERTRSLEPARRGVIAWIAGPERLSAQRVVPGEARDVER